MTVLLSCLPKLLFFITKLMQKLLRKRFPSYIVLLEWRGFLKSNLWRGHHCERQQNFS